MQLKPDCVRDVLLTIEAKPLDWNYQFDELCDVLPKWSVGEVQYTCLKLKEGKFLDIVTVEYEHEPLPAVLYVYNLTFQGHEYLETVRDADVWRKTKKVAASIGNFSLDMLKEVAKSFSSAAAEAAIKVMLQTP